MEEIIKYFKGDQLAANTWNNKYRWNEEEKTPREMHSRMAKALAKAEWNYAHEYKVWSEYSSAYKNLSSTGKSVVDTFKHGEGAIYERFFQLLKHFDHLIGGGSIMEALGTDKLQSLSNCFFNGAPEDSLGDIMRVATNMAQVGKLRGGSGTDISNLRPRGAAVHNAASESTGSVSFMSLYGTLGKLIGQNNRHMAMMISIDGRHPDVEEFITIKQNLEAVTTANISVKVTEDFMQAVREDKDYILRWPVDVDISFVEKDTRSFEYGKLYPLQKIGVNGYYKIIRAKELWNKLIHGAWKAAEPKRKSGFYKMYLNAGKPKSLMIWLSAGKRNYETNYML